MAKGRKAKTKETPEPKEPIGTFPQISSKTKIKDVVFAEKGPKVHFGKFEVSTGQADLLKGLAESGEEVLITISPIQGRLPGTT